MLNQVKRSGPGVCRALDTNFNRGVLGSMMLTAREACDRELAVTQKEGGLRWKIYMTFALIVPFVAEPFETSRLFV
jgi:hypothetical protein